MPPPREVSLGHMTQIVLDGAVWQQASEYPASQVWADEAERLFAFLETQQMFHRFLPRLRAREREMTSALAEARAGFFFHRNGFRILRWEPEEVCGHPGDLDIQWGETDPIFVEVKGPGWEGELTEAERKARRKELPKYIDAESRLIAPLNPVFYAVNKALPKLAERRSNLVVLVDDLFVSPIDLPNAFLTSDVENFLSDSTRRCVGGVFLLKPVCHGDFVEYSRYFVRNIGAVRPLPDLPILNEDVTDART